MPNAVFFKDEPFLASFSLFLSFLLYNWQIKFCQCLELNCRSLMLEATALPTEPQPLPKIPNAIFYSNLNRVGFIKESDATRMKQYIQKFDQL